jgi:cysteine protease ATG4
MSNKNSRTASPASPQQNVPASKLPRFLQKAAARDRSKSVTDPSSQSTSPPTSPSPEVQSTPIPGKTPRKASKFLGMRDKQPSDSLATPETEEPPVIVEPVAIPRPRTRAERTASSVPDSTMYSSSPSSSRIGDLPTRLSGWFSHTFSTSSTDLSLPNILATHTSPKGKPNALLTAAKHGRGHLDKAVRYLLDSDSTPDKCTDPIWLLGVQHPGYEPSNPATPPNAAAGHQTSGSPNSFRSSTSSVASLSSNSNEQAALSQSQTSQKFNPAANWPPVFYIDFTSRIWLTYRSQFPLPIKDGRLADLCGGPTQPAVPATPSKRSLWNLVGGEKTWSSDSGWGCMLRTGQSLLANALVHVHLGRG